MKRFVCYCTGLCFLVCSTVPALAQDPEFTQFYANPLYLNPAFAGSKRCPRFHLNYRNQWPALTGTFVTTSASYDQYLCRIGGVGLLFTKDKAGEGTITTTNFSGMYAYHFNINRFFSLSAGFQATFFEKKLDWEKLTFGDMIDPRRGFSFQTQEIPGSNVSRNFDISAGILGYSERVYFGFVCHHLTEPDEYLMIGPSPLPRKYTGHAGAVLPTGSKGDEIYISPNVLYQRQQDFQQLNLGLYVTKGPITGGLWYRNEDSFIVLLGFEQEFFKVGYSYDVTVSKLTNRTAGSHEISFATQFSCKKCKKKFRTYRCPSF